MKKYYGLAPTIISDFINIEPSEMCFFQYLPIKMSSIEKLGNDIKIPTNLLWVGPLVDLIRNDIKDEYYLYLTVKHIYVVPNNMGNRPGWHSDGFKTDDLNYIWTDCFPTEFCIKEFNISNNCELSMIQMEEQADIDNIKIYPEKSFLKLDQYNIHRSPILGSGYRTFVKLSLSKDKYNLKGNAHNYLFDYQWNMKERAETRNHPHQ